MKKYKEPFILAIFLLLGLVVWFAKFTITSGERYDKFSRTTLGYKIEKYYFWNSTRLTFWSNRTFNSEMKSVYEFSGLTVDKIEEERWVNNDTAIYLNLQIMYQDSMVSVKPARIIYDFHRSEIHTSSSFTLWRIWNEKNKSEDWMNEGEFDAVLSRLSK
jgi:hypothetical protein